MYVCMYVCMYMFICVYICKLKRTYNKNSISVPYVCMYVCMCLHAHTHTHTHTHTCMHARTYMRAGAGVQTRKHNIPAPSLSMLQAQQHALAHDSEIFLFQHD